MRRRLDSCLASHTRLRDRSTHAGPGASGAADRVYFLIWEDRFLVRFQLRPGDIETCDNGRVLHARDAVGPSTEERLLQGCDVDRDEVQSRIRILQREEARAWL